MDPALVIVLSEHLGWVSKHPESLPHSENISQSRTAWLSALDGFADMEQKFAAKLDEWREKWQQRFEMEGVAQIVATGADEIKKVKNAKEKEQLAKALYLNTVHLMIGDAQKYLITINSRAELLQENIRKIWHKNCLNDSYSKILPSIESSFQNYEETFFGNIRNSFFEDQKDSVPSIARQEFLEAIMANDNCNLILNSELLQENIRKIWHKNCLNDSYSKILPSIESSFQNYEETFFGNIRNSFFEDQKDSVPSIARQEFLEAIMANDNCNLILNFYFLKIFRQISKISANILKFYSKKWALYARGFSCRQNLLPLG
ncbi:hypothetical protein R83H12_00665 [Fibrobacteria bacterium R8-3-H12]